MAQNFRVPRNVEQSCINYLTTNLATSWQGAAVVQTFKQVYATTMKLPVVCVRLSDTSTVYREIGNKIMEDRYLIIVDIFANSDGQRLDLAYTIKSLLANGWIHYDYSRQSGDITGEIVGTADGYDTVTSFVQDSRVDFGESTDNKDKYRHQISIRVRNSPNVPTY